MHWSTLTLREQIAQTIVAQYVPPMVDGKPAAPERFLDTCPVGGVFLGGEVIKTPDTASREIADTVLALQRASRVPLAVCGDLEHGAGAVVQGLANLPYQMALGATASETLAYAYGQSTALEGRAVGFNWSLSPVADLNQNRFNPVTNVRSISDDPELAMRLLPRLVRGMQDQGMAATAKHFPGDGTDYRDQHLVTTHNRLPMPEWRRHHGAVFQRLIDEDVWAIMTGHIALPAYQRQDVVNGLPLPATLSPELSTRLLKQEMGFRGVIVSDALMMGGFLKWRPTRVQAEVDCFAAGTDMLLWPSAGYPDALEQALLQGKVPMTRLEDALNRIWRMKDHLGLFSENSATLRPLQPPEQIVITQTAVETANQSVTLVADHCKRLPIDRTKIQSVGIVLLCHDEKLAASFSVLQKELEARDLRVTLARNAADEGYRALVREHDLVLIAIALEPHKPMGSLGLFGFEAWSLWWSLTDGREKSVVVSFGSPYILADYFAGAQVCIAAYGVCPESQRAVVRALFGEIPWSGKLPVTDPYLQAMQG